ncbi:MAG: phage holin family protein [Chloroflexota bacterium]|jgi:putative membrane protein
MGVIVSFVISWLLAALVIYIVGRLNLGLTVDSFVSALIAAAVIAVVTWVVVWLLGLLGINLDGGWLGAIVGLIVAALILMVSDRFVSGMKVAGFGGAIIAAIAIAVVTWLASWLTGLLGF